MAWTPPGAGQLRDAVRFERKLGASNVGGVVKGDWAVLIERRSVLLLPERGGEAVTAARLAGQSVWTLVCRLDSATKLITADDRAVDVRDPTRVFDIRSSLDLEGRGRWLVMTLEQGVGDGRTGT